MEHPVHAERRPLDCQGSSDNGMLCRWCHHTPGTAWSCIQECRGTSGCFLLAKQTMWRSGSQVALESDNSTCWCKESISLHPILIWINTVPFQVCSWDSGHPRAWVWISFQTLSPWEMKYSIFQAAELAPSGLEFGWRFLFLGLSFSDTYLLCALHKGGLEASFQGLLSIKELSASHKALENPQIFVGSF